MVEALTLLMLTWGAEYVEQNHGQAYHNFEQKIEEYHVDKVVYAYDVYENKHITFKWEF